jgi:anti-sigma28 factor (negative regulator of flagellin synthesis)
VELEREFQRVNSYLPETEQKFRESEDQLHQIADEYAVIHQDSQVNSPKEVVEVRRVEDELSRELARIQSNVETMTKLRIELKAKIDDLEYFIDSHRIIQRYFKALIS